MRKMMAGIKKLFDDMMFKYEEAQMEAIRRGDVQVIMGLRNEVLY